MNINGVAANHTLYAAQEADRIARTSGRPYKAFINEFEYFARRHTVYSLRRSIQEDEVYEDERTAAAYWGFVTARGCV